jgi:hypothetical protein
VSSKERGTINQQKPNARLKEHFEEHLNEGAKS